MNINSANWSQAAACCARIVLQTRLYAALVVALASMAGQPAGAQDETPESPPLPYFSAADSSRKFNVPIPDGWNNLSSGDQAHFTNERLQGEIYVLAVSASDTAAGIRQALADLLPGSELEARATTSANLEDGTWVQHLYDLPDGGTVTAFGHMNDGSVYIVTYINRRSGSPLYMLTIQAADSTPETGLNAALELLYPGERVATSEASEVVYGGEVWFRTEAAFEDGSPLHALAQTQGSLTTYTVIDGGSGDLLDGVATTFYTVFLGFFITPANDGYLYLALAAVAGLMALLMASMAIRYRSLQHDLRLIEELEAQGSWRNQNESA